METLRILRRDSLVLYHARDNDDADGVVQVADVLHELDDGLACADDGIDEDDGVLTIQMLEIDVGCRLRMEEPGLREDVVHAESHGLAAAHQRDDGRAGLVRELCSVRCVSEDVGDWLWGEADDGA